MPRLAVVDAPWALLTCLVTHFAMTPESVRQRMRLTLGSSLRNEKFRRLFRTTRAQNKTKKAKWVGRGGGDNGLLGTTCGIRRANLQKKKHKS